MRTPILLAAVAVSLALPAVAQHAPGQHAPTPHASPYAAETGRAIKALSENETRDYLEGKGMGLARAAELNGYPGPMHVLELAAPLGLTDEQRARTEALFRSMRAEAIAAGRALIDAERELDQLFATRAATEAPVTRSVALVGERAANVRRVHLQAHIAQHAILTPEQVRRYAELRGYGGAHTSHAPGAHHAPNTHRGHH